MGAQKRFKDFINQPGIAEIKKEFKEKGLRAEDINFALALGYWIEVFDSLVFSDTAPIKFCDWPSSDGTVALYWPSKKYYVIYVPNLCQRMKEEWQRQLISMTKNGRVSYPLSRFNKRKLISWREAMIGLAVHEVRHRMQETPGFNIFTDVNPRPNSTTWSLYMKLASKRDITREDILELELSSQRDDRERSKQKINIEELDALTIEGTAISLSHIGSPIAGIAETIRMQPKAVVGTS